MVLMVAIFLAPVSAGVKVNDKQQLAIRTEVDKVKAQTSATVSIIPKDTSVDITVKIPPDLLVSSRDYNLSIILFDNTSNNNGTPPDDAKSVKKDDKDVKSSETTVNMTFTDLTPSHKYYAYINLVEKKIFVSPPILLCATVTFNLFGQKLKKKIKFCIRE